MQQVSLIGHLVSILNSVIVIGCNNTRYVRGMTQFCSAPGHRIRWNSDHACVIEARNYRTICCVPLFGVMPVP